ncbi:MAG: endonuclease/exonuclease/phosphatase family protein [Deferribacteres bacterium]|nr:endonuclease/exonuclease/phosphatase family protein [candidate division KSB1 bacterium]MCB9504204.1 endonuclease/exonuclease/phosphatase family protein [Deferribacteres bacterium]
MKIGLLFVIPVVLLSGCSMQDQCTNKVFRVMSFNIRNDNSDDGQHVWMNRKEGVAKMLDFHRVDIAGMQEVLKNQLEDIKRMAPEFAAVGVGRTDGKEKGEYAPIFYRTSRFSVADWGTFWLSETPADTGSRGWDAALERIVTWALMQDKNDHKQFYFFNTHFDHRGEEARRNSAALIMYRIRDVAGDKPVVLSGDFNLDEHADPYFLITKGDAPLIDSRIAVGDAAYGPYGTYTGFNGDEKNLRNIDFIFVNDRIDVLRQGIISENWNGILPSDHRPVVADIRFKKR